MSKTSTASKNKYNAKAYDQIPLRVKKGEKNIIKEYAESKGMSMQGFINYAIMQAMGKEPNNN